MIVFCSLVHRQSRQPETKKYCWMLKKMVKVLIQSSQKKKPEYRSQSMYCIRMDIKMSKLSSIVMILVKRVDPGAQLNIGGMRNES